MKNTFIKKILSSVAAVSVAVAALGTTAVPVWAFDAPQPDTGAAGGISNGGEWSIYSSRFAKIRGTFEEQTDSAGILEVTGSAGIGAAFQFDLSTKDDNPAAENKVIKSATLRLTPMVSKSGLNQNLYTVNNEFNTTEDKEFVAGFSIPRGSRDDFFSAAEITALSADSLSAYPEDLANWQTAIDVTGEVINAGDTVSFLVEYGSGNTNKTEYATSNIDANNRLNGGGAPLFYSGGATEYSKWVYPQIVFEYTDSEIYRQAYADFVSVNSQLSGKTVTEESGVEITAPENGSEVSIEIYGDASAPIKVVENGLAFNEQYVGDATSANVILTVTKTDGAETASYSRTIEVGADYTKSNMITFSTERNPLGVVSVESAGTTYTDGTAYAKPGGVFTVNGGENIGYTANITVRDAEDNIVAQNADGTYTMPNSDVTVSVEYTKGRFGTTRAAAINSISLRNNGTVQGNGSDVIIAADRMTFVKFDLSNYDESLISDATLQFTKNKGTSNSKAIFLIPNNDWDEGSFSGDFCIDGTEDTRMSAFKQSDGTTVVLYADENRKTLIAPGTNQASNDDMSAAANGILGEYYLTSTGTSTTDSIDVTEAIKTALAESEDKIITLLVYSVGTTGGDYRSVTNAETLAARPSLTITESSAGMPDSELVTEIDTIEDLENFAEIVNGGHNYAGKTVTLNTDLDLSEKYNAETRESWTPIGSYDAIGGTNPFGGVFEGGGHTISGLYINGNESTQGLFGIVSGSVKDLSVSGAINASSVVGGIAGWSSGEITNCDSSVTINAQREAGGIVGALSGGGVISNCDNSGAIAITQKESYAGGIAGHVVDAAISECTNAADIENGMDGFRNRLGGIVGLLENGEVSGCDNSGNIRSDATVASYTADTSQNYVGGIAGYSSFGVIRDSNNTGDVYNAVDFAGGISGYLKGSDEVTNCYNSGAVSGRSYVGGITGSSASSISNCQNEGAVTAADKYAGGIVGYLSTGDIKDSYSSAAVTGTEFYGDIFGYNSAGTVTFTEPESGFKAEYIDGKAVVTAPEAGEYALIFAAYNSAGVLKSMEVQEITFAGPGTQIFEPMNFDAEGMTVKLMLWDGIDSMQPKF